MEKNKLSGIERELVLQYLIDGNVPVIITPVSENETDDDEIHSLNSEIYSSQIDLDTKDKLYNLIYLAIKQRLVMLLGLENIVPLVSLETFDNVHSAYNSILNAYRTKILKLCKDKEVNEFIKKYNDIEIYAKDENFRFDYVNTYSKILRQLSDIRDEKLEYMRSIIHNDEDILEEEILSNQLVEVPVSEFIVDTEEDC